MRDTYKIEDGVLMAAGENPKIIHFYDITDQEKKDIAESFQIDDHTLLSCLDIEEVPRIEIDENKINIILKIPTTFSIKDSQPFLVKSIGIFFRNDVVVIISNDNNDYIESKVNMKIDNNYNLILYYFNTIIKHFMGHLRTIRLISKELQKEINKSMDNESLLLMFDLSEILVYYLDAIESNEYVIKKFVSKLSNMEINYNEEFSDDILNEIDQAKTQAEIYSQIFAGLMDARGTIINNNMNILIKNLTIINIVFLPLNLLASMGGMSEFSKWTEQIPWPISYGLFTVGIIFIGYISMLFINRSSKKITRQIRSNNRFDLTSRLGHDAG